MTMSCRHIGLVFVILGVHAVSAVAADRSPCKGPLRVHPRNPRYFTDGSGKAILLAGSHTWRSVQEAAISLPANPPFDYAEFFQLLEKENHNFTRLWAWESAAWVQPKSVKMWIDPLPFQRTGPGNAADGRPKFDVTKFNEAYFERLRTRAAAAGERGIYVGVMLFEGFSVSRKSRNRDPSPWLYHPLNRANNVNGLDGDLNGDGEGYEVHELRVPEITRVQEAYVRKVIDAVGDLDNVLLEIGNECHGGSTQWQYHMIEVIRRYERARPKQHLVWMTFPWDGLAGPGTNENLFTSGADVVSPGSAAGNNKRAYETDPPAADGTKVVIADTDHIHPGNMDRADWVWKCFTRGLHPIFMDNPPIPGNPLHPVHNDFLPDGPSARTRAAMGATLAVSEKVDLAGFVPDSKLSSTGYCLANAGREYLVYLPDGGEATVDLSAAPGPFVVEWFHPETGTVTAAGTTPGGAKGPWRAPFPGTAVLHLKAKGPASREYHVAARGSDANAGTAIAPFRTIQKAADVARRGDTVLVHDGCYPEQVKVANSGVAFRATEGETAKVDGAGERRFGFYAPPEMAVTDISIEGFEVAGQTQAAISATGKRHARFHIRNNRVHHASEKGAQLRGTGHLVEGNTVYMIGNAQEAMGVFLTGSSGSTVRDNQIFLCKKEGIRDFAGHENRIEDNIVYLCWTGLAFNSSEGGVIACNNYLYQNVMGFNPKHTQGNHGWNRFWHNTVFDSAGWSVGIGINDPPLDYLDIRNNIFSSAGEAHVYETPETIGAHLILDGNLYHRQANRPPLVYLAHGRTKAATIEELQQRTSHEKHGIERNPLLVDPAHGDLDYPPASPAAQGGLLLESTRGKQLGARGLRQTTPDFVRLPLRAVAASSNEALMAGTTDNLHHTTWDSGTAISDQWILYDLGAQRSLRYIVLVPFGHKVEHNVRDFSFDVSDERREFTTILGGTNNDSGSIFIYELASPVTTRYLRFTMKNKFPDDGFTWTRSQIKFADLWVGNLTVKQP